MQHVRAKVVELGLDPEDTTGPELYSALQVKLAQDDVAVAVALGLKSDASPGETLSAVQRFLQKSDPGNCFALKLTVTKQLLKKRPPKNVMRGLGYRSFDSLLKHEPLAAIYAACMIAESPTWHRQFRAQYTKLQPTDFEQRHLDVIYPKAKRWTTFAEEYVSSARHNILSIQELGTVVILPIPRQLDGLAITSLLLVLYYMNDIRAYSSFAKLQQVKPAFGKIIRRASSDSDRLVLARLAGEPVTWKTIQHYYGHLTAGTHPAVFEPHVQPEDLRWRDAETVLAELEPTLRFWEGTRYTCMIDSEEPVSFNILDVALGYCNHLSFADRIVHFAREHLWHELMGRYLQQGNVEYALHQQLASDLVDSPEIA
jgi:hypothetical protein